MEAKLLFVIKCYATQKLLHVVNIRGYVGVTTFYIAVYDWAHLVILFQNYLSRI